MAERTYRQRHCVWRPRAAADARAGGPPRIQVHHSRESRRGCTVLAPDDCEQWLQLITEFGGDPEFPVGRWTLPGTRGARLADCPPDELVDTRPVRAAVPATAPLPRVRHVSVDLVHVSVDVDGRSSGSHSRGQP
jgi:hypothetical protein